MKRIELAVARQPQAVEPTLRVHGSLPADWPTEPGVLTTASEEALAQGRGTGKTARQMTSCPMGSHYVWHCAFKTYPRNLSIKLGRQDLKVVSPDELESLRGLPDLVAVIVDHDATLTKSQLDVVKAINSIAKYGVLA